MIALRKFALPSPSLSPSLPVLAALLSRRPRTPGKTRDEALDSLLEKLEKPDKPDRDGNRPKQSLEARTS